MSRGDEATRRSGVLRAVGARTGDEASGRRGRGVLVVESEDASLAAWTSALSQLGAPVLGTREIGAARASTSAAVVVLGNLPYGQCPIAFARDLRSRHPDERPRVLIVARDAIRRVDRVHVDAVLPRPIRMDALVSEVRRLLALSERTTPGMRREPGRLG